MKQDDTWPKTVLSFSNKSNVGDDQFSKTLRQQFDFVFFYFCSSLFFCSYFLYIIF